MAEQYTGTELRRGRPRTTQREIPGLSSNKAVLKYRKHLDEAYDYMSDPFESWSAKRGSVRRMMEKYKPNHTESDLDLMYNQVGLSDQSTPGDFTRDKGFFGSASRAMDFAGKSFSQLYDVAGLKFDEAAGDTEGMMENQRQIQQAQHEAAVIRQYEMGPEEDRNVIKQFVWDLTASAPVMVGIMGAGALGGIALAKIGVVAWLAGMLGMGAADALTEMGFNYADIVGDPTVREKMRNALKGQMTQADEEEIKLEVQKRLMEQADDSAVKVGLVNFFNPLNSPYFSGIRKLIKPGSAKLGAIRRAAFQSATREGVEEFLQSSGSQYTANEAKVAALKGLDVDVSEPLRPDTVLGIDLGQAFYEGLMGFTVGAGIGGFQGMKGHLDYFAGKADVDPESGNLKYKRPGDEEFVPAGQIRLETRKNVDLKADENALSSLDNWREGKDEREKLIIDDEIRKMKNGSTLLGEKSTPETRERRKTVLSEYEAGKHLTPSEVAAAGDAEAAIVAELNQDPKLLSRWKRIRAKNANKRTEFEKIFFKIAQEDNTLSYKEVRELAIDEIRDNKPEAPPTKGPTKKSTTRKKATTAEGVETEGVETEATVEEEEVAEEEFGEETEVEADVEAEAEEVETEVEEEDVTPTEASTVTAQNLTEGVLNRGDSSVELSQLLSDSGVILETKEQKKAQDGINKGQLKAYVLNNPKKVQSTIVTRTGAALAKALEKGTATSYTEYHFTPEQRLEVANILAAMSGVKLKVKPKAAVKPKPTATTTTTTEAEVEGEVETEVETETVVGINRKTPDRVHYNEAGEPVEQTIDDSQIGSLIGKIVSIERGQTAREETIYKEEGYGAAPSGENVPAGTIPSGERKAGPRTKRRVVRFESINDKGEIIFTEPDADFIEQKTGLTIPKLFRYKRPISKGEAENALRHLQTGQSKTFIYRKGLIKAGEVEASLADASFTTIPILTDAKPELSESAQADKVRGIYKKLIDLKAKVKKMMGKKFTKAHHDKVILAIDKALGFKKPPKAKLQRINQILGGKFMPTKAQTKIFDQINQLRDELITVLRTVTGAKPTVKEGAAEPPPKGPRRSPLGNEQREINIRIKNLNEALKDGKLSVEDKIRIIDDMERTARELGAQEEREINLKIDDVVLETGATQDPPVAGTREWLVVHIAKESRDINPSDLLRIIRLSGYKIPELQHYTERPEGQFGMEIADHVPLKSKKYFVTKEEQANLDAKYEGWKANTEALYDALVVRLRGTFKKPDVVDLKETTTEVEPEGKPTATVIPFPAPTTKTEPTSEVKNYDNGDKYVGEVKQGKETTIRHGSGTYTWASGDKYVGEWMEGESHGQGTKTYASGRVYEGAWKNGEQHGQGTMTFPNGDTFKGTYKNNDSWEGTQYFKDGKIKNIISKGKAYNVKTETEEPPPPSEEEVVTEEEVATEEETPPEETEDATVEVSGWEEQMTISTKELEDAVAGDNKEVYFDLLNSDPRYSTDISQWDGTGYTNSNDFTKEIKDNLGIDPDEKTTRHSEGYNEAEELRKLIREKLMNHIEYKFLENNSYAGILRWRDEIEARWWFILDKKGKEKVNERLRVVRKDGSPAALKIKLIPLTLLKKKTKIIPKKKAEPLKADFLSENMVSAVRKIPTITPSTPDVWFIWREEADGIFAPAATVRNKPELDDFLAKVKGNFVVVRQPVTRHRETEKWYAIEINKDSTLTGKKMPVPITVRKKLTREGKDLDTAKPEKQLSKKLKEGDLTGTETLASEALAQLFKSEDVSIQLREALANDRVIYTLKTKEEKDQGKVLEVWWLDKDGSWKTDDEENRSYVVFKDMESAAEFDENIRSIDEERTALLDQESAKARENLLQEYTIKDLMAEDQRRGEQFNPPDESTVETLGVWSREEEVRIAAENKGKRERFDETEFDRQQRIADYEASGQREKLEADMAEKARIEQAERDAARNRKTTLESREVDGKPREFLSLEEVEQQVQEFRDEYPASFPVEIVETHTDLPSIQDESLTSGMIEDGKVWIVRDRMYDKETVLKNLWHEEIGHLGIENFLGEKKFNELVTDLQESLPENVKEEYLAKIPEDFGSLEARKTQSMREYLAYNADERFENIPATVWEKIVSWLRDALRTAGVKIDFNELDLKMLVLRSADKLRGDTAATLIEGTGIKQRRIVNTDGLDAGTVKFFDKLYPKEEGIAGGWNWKEMGTYIVSKIWDPFTVINKKIGKVPYMLLRLANRSDGVLAAVLRYSGVKTVKTVVDGVTINELHSDDTIKPLFRIFKSLGAIDEINRFIGWVAAHRADMLKGENRERFFSKEEIVEGLKANKGMMKDARTGSMTSREVLYKQVAEDLAKWNKGIVDVGIGFGLFNAQAAHAWNTEWYVPFFRLAEKQIGEEKSRGVANYKDLTGQKGVHELRGSEKGLNNPLNNLIKNALHIIDASIKNDAAVTTLQEAAKIRDPESGRMLAEVTENESRSVRVIKNGFNKFYNINNELLFEALASLHSDTKFAGFGWAVKAKGLFTQIVTASPVFKYWNVLRDTMSAAGTTDVGFNLLKNSVGGYMSLGAGETQLAKQIGFGLAQKDIKADMLISGAYIQFAYNRSDDPNYAKKLLTKEMTTGFIAANPENHSGFKKAWEVSRKLTSGVWGQYQAVGDKLENANRAAIFKGLAENNKSMTERAYEARDLLDFTLHGSADWVRLVTALTPFANAMLQGKYKLGRAIINNPKPVVVVSSAMVLASLMEYYVYEEDKEWHRRPDWDKDTFFWIKLPGTDTRFRMPKPHEFSLIGNLAWRGIQMAKEKDPVHGPLFASAIRSVLFREFNVSPIPQVVKPLIEIGINKNLFFDRPIEPLGVKNLSPSEKRGMYTSETMIMFSKGMENILWEDVVLSPYQLEHIVNGYFGWLGQTILAGTDFVTRKAYDFPEKPAAELMDHPIARKLFQASPIRNTRAAGIFYARLKEIEQANADLNLAKKLGDWDHYREIYEEKKDVLKWKTFIRKKQRILNNINKRIYKVRFDMNMSAESKRMRMDRFYSIRNRILDILAKSPAMR